jgi:hypothetical protein
VTREQMIKWAEDWPSDVIDELEKERRKHAQTLEDRNQLRGLVKRLLRDMDQGPQEYLGYDYVEYNPWLKESE